MNAEEKERTRTMKTLALSFLLALGACSGSSSGSAPLPAPSAPVNLTGEWTGVWASAKVNAGGGITATLRQKASQVTGPVSIGGSSCASLPFLSGTVTGDQVKFWIGSIQATGRVNSASDRMDCIYIITFGPCQGDSGTIVMMLDEP